MKMFPQCNFLQEQPEILRQIPGNSKKVYYGIAQAITCFILLSSTLNYEYIFKKTEWLYNKLLISFQFLIQIFFGGGAKELARTFWDRRNGSEVWYFTKIFDKALGSPNRTELHPILLSSCPRLHSSTLTRWIGHPVNLQWVQLPFHNLSPLHKVSEKTPLLFYM